MAQRPCTPQTTQQAAVLTGLGCWTDQMPGAFAPAVTHTGHAWEYAGLTVAASLLTAPPATAAGMPAGSLTYWCG